LCSMLKYWAGLAAVNGTLFSVGWFYKSRFDSYVKQELPEESKNPLWFFKRISIGQPAPASAFSELKGTRALSPDEFRSFPLQSKHQVNHDSTRLRFTLPNPNDEVGMQVSSCLLTAYDGPEGKKIVRPYTPISTNDEKGYFDLLVKRYPEGNASRHLTDLKVGDSVDVKGPIEKLKYVPNMKKNLYMIAGGSGITPMYQVIREIIKNPTDATKIHLIFSNKTAEDILLKEELEQFAKNDPQKRLKLTYVLSNKEGDLNTEKLKALLPAPNDTALIYVCGPPGMMKALTGEKKSPADQGPLTGSLKDLGWNEKNVYKF